MDVHDFAIQREVVIGNTRVWTWTPITVRVRGRWLKTWPAVNSGVSVTVVWTGRRKPSTNQSTGNVPIYLGISFIYVHVKISKSSNIIIFIDISIFYHTSMYIFMENN